MDNISISLGGGDPHSDEIRNYPAKGPEYGKTPSSLVNPQNLPTHDKGEIQTYTDTFSDNCDAVAGGNSSPFPEGNIQFANGPEIRKTRVMPATGLAPGPQ